jgi:hypothetical protein
MKRSKTLSLTLVAASFFAATQTQAAETDPVGYVTLTIAGSTDGVTPAFTPISVPLQQAVEASGSITTNPAGATLENSSASYTANEFATTDSVGNGQFYLQFTSGDSTGLILDIVSNTATSITTNADLSGLVASGDSYIIKELMTLADVFGADNSAGLRSGGDAASSDLIYIMSSDGAGVYATYYYQTDSLGFLGGDGWRAFGDPNSDVSDVVIGPDDG